MIENSLASICQYFNKEIKENYADIIINNIEQDSRLVDEHCIFFAKVGHNVDGRDFIQEAIAKGAKAIVVTQEHSLTQEQQQQLSVPVLVLDEGKSMGSFANWFYHYPSADLTIIGVTGTNGKTTCTHIIASLLTSMGYKCGVIGTVGCGFLGNLTKSKNTTLDELLVQKQLRALADDNATHVAMEVSSIGVCEHRIDYVEFNIAAFSNLSRDHLDYHQTMENYAQAKFNFLEKIKDSSNVVINIHDVKGRDFASRLNKAFLVGYVQDKENISVSSGNCLLINKLSYSNEGIVLNLGCNTKKYNCVLPLLGEFNAQNFILALGVMFKLGFDLEEILTHVKNIKPVAGRMELIVKENMPSFVIDYAHTPDGLEKALSACKEHFADSDIYCIIGCGGDRDAGKRPIMAQKACVYADYVIFTDDNPRSEKPQKIIEDMLMGVKNSTDNFTVEHDRHKAIELAFSLAKANDCILVAGKGHEDYQIVKNKTIHFSDRQEVLNILGLNNA